MGYDKMIPRHVYDKPFTIRFPDTGEWKTGFNPTERGDESGIQTVRRHWSWGILLWGKAET
jgi:hypothetical protein